MASIFDTTEKQPISTTTLYKNGFLYINTSKGKCFELTRRIRGVNTWVARYWPRGANYDGKKLRSNRLVYKEFRPVDKESRSRKSRWGTPTNYKKNVMRNIGMDDLIATVKACGHWIDEAFKK